MADTERISKYIAGQVKSGAIDREIGFDIFKIVNQYAELMSGDIAIVGIACRFPQAHNTEQYWDNLVKGINCIRKFPDARKRDVAPLIEGGMASSEDPFIKAGYIDEIDKFDAGFFRISPKEAEMMDPWQRLFLQTAYEAMEDAGYGGSTLSGTRTGVYVGVDHTYKADYAPKNREIDFSSLTGSYHAILASRVSYMLNLKGPSMTVDTACSSALVAVNLACKALKNRECAAAIVGGINLFLFPDRSRNGVSVIEAQDDSIKVFDKASKGSAWGEGVGALLLKPLKKAISDNDNIYAVIKGCAVNNNGTSNGITALNSQAQEEVILKAWEDANIDPETIAYVEAHGTGTLLGDSIEIRGLSDAFRKHTKKKQFCGIGSVKTNVGHMVSASGMASIIKVVMSLKNKLLPSTINFDEPNSYINFLDSPVYINDRLKAWDTADTLRRAGISCFGFSGTNVHIVLEEAPRGIMESKKDQKATPQVFSLSAKSEETLMRLVNCYVEFLGSDKNTGFEDISFTANCGRGHYNYRLSMLARDRKHLLENLRAILQLGLNAVKIDNLYYGEHNVVSPIKKTLDEGEITEDTKRKISGEVNSSIDNSDALGEEAYERMLDEICSAYVKGADIHWDMLYKNKGCKRVSLPTYPYENTRYWSSIGFSQTDISDFKGKPDENRGIYEFDVAQKDINKRMLGNVARDEGGSYDIKLIGNKDGVYTDNEKSLAEVWGEALGFEEINIYDNFFEIGGDSITAMKIANRINKRLEVFVGVSEMLNYPSIAELAGYLDSMELKKDGGRKKDNIYSLIKKAEENSYYPLSLSQKGVYIANSYDEKGVSCNIPQFLYMEGSIERERFEKAFRQLIARHEALRTSFHIVNGEPVQRVNADVEFEIEYLECSEGDIACITQEFIKPFDLSKAPLIRIGMAKCSENRHLFMFDIHHIIGDAQSITILIKEAMILYYDMELPELNIQYKDFAVWQKKIMEDGLISGQEEYWLNTFSGNIPESSIPSDYDRPPIKSYEGDSITFTAGEELTAAIYSLTAETGTTTFMLLLAVLNILISKYSAKEDIVIGSPIMGRPHAELENVVGMFVNMLAIRNYPLGDKTFIEFLEEVKQSVLNAYENQDYQFESLAGKLNNTRDLSRTPIFDISFSVQEVSIPEIRINDLKLIPYKSGQKNALYDIVLIGTESNKNISFLLEYYTKVFKRETMDMFAEDYLSILKAAANNHSIKIKDLELKYESSYVKRKKSNIDDIDFSF